MVNKHEMLPSIAESRSPHLTMKEQNQCHRIIAVVIMILIVGGLHIIFISMPNWNEILGSPTAPGANDQSVLFEGPSWSDTDIEEGTVADINDKEGNDDYIGLKAATTPPTDASAATSINKGAIHRNNVGRGLRLSSNIMTINYHKTGDHFTADLMRILSEHQNKLQVLLFYKYKNGKWIGKNNEVIQTEKRSHLKQTWCPAPLNANKLREGNINFQSVSPDLFCSQDDLSDYLEDVDKTIHMIRDPIDMVLSNYLYHSQSPPPEPWVHTITDPCSPNQDLIEFVMPKAGINKAKEIDPIVDACKSYFYGNETHPGYPQQTFYQRLKSLPLMDGLKLATTQILLSNYSLFAGGDLMRMSGNAFALSEWDSRDHGQVRNVFMDDLKYNLKNKTLELADFILSGSVTDDDERRELCNQVASDMESSVNEKINSGSDHITTAILTAAEREETMKRIQNEKVFGSVLLKLRSMMNAVKYQDVM